MAKHKVLTTDVQIDRAIGRAAGLKHDPRVIAVEYRPGEGLDLLILKLSDGHRHLVPREDLEGLRGASREQIADVEIVGNGTGLHWPALNLDHYVPGLLRHVYGTKRWMTEIGREGGAARTSAKRNAAQKNGLKGGRPKRSPLTTLTA